MTLVGVDVSLTSRSSAYSQWSVETAMQRQTNDVRALTVVVALSTVFFVHSRIATPSHVINGGGSTSGEAAPAAAAERTAAVSLMARGRRGRDGRSTIASDDRMKSFYPGDDDDDDRHCCDDDVTRTRTAERARRWKPEMASSPSASIHSSPGWLRPLVPVRRPARLGVAAINTSD